MTCFVKRVRSVAAILSEYVRSLYILRAVRVVADLLVIGSTIIARHADTTIDVNTCIKVKECRIMVKCKECKLCGKSAVLIGGLCYYCRVKADRSLGNVIKYDRDKCLGVVKECVSKTYTEMVHDAEVMSDPLRAELVRRCVELADELARLSPYLPSSVCTASDIQNCHYCDDWDCDDNLMGREKSDA